MRSPIRLSRAFAAAFFSLWSIAALPHAEAGEFNAGINIVDKASAAQTGLSVYPGAKPADKSQKDDSDANIDFSFGGYGLKVVVVRLQTEDAADKVAAFYRNDLARYGSVIDCGDPQAPRAKPSAKDADEDDDRIVCKKNESKRGAITYRVGTRRNQRVASIESSGGFTRINLVRVEVRKP